MHNALTTAYQIDSMTYDMYYQYDNGYRTSEAPDEFVIDGDPTEVWVPVTLWIQAHRQAFSKEADSQIRQKSYSIFPQFITKQARETGSMQQHVIIWMTVAVKVRDITDQRNHLLY